jgi:branched-chain amino acid transport system ATP-binding protein
MADPVLSIANLSAGYGTARVLEGLSLAVFPGELVAIIGANGAGKTTLFKSVMGLIPATGSVRFQDQDLLRARAYRRAELGVGYVPEGRHVFPNLNVEENLRVGAFRSKGSLSEGLERIYDLFPRLRERRSQLAASLSGGEQQMLALGRALILDPKLLLIDEISLGLAPIIVDRMFDVLRQLHTEGTTILLAEQNARKTLEAADRAYVLETGRIVLEGPADELRADARVIDAYLQSLDVV